MMKNRQIKYKKLYDQLRSRFFKAAPGERLDSIRLLQKEYKVSLATLNSALKMLADENVIECVQYKGLFRKDPTAATTSRTVVLILPGREEPLFQKIIFSCHNALEKLGAKMQLVIYDLSMEAEFNIVKKTLEENADGILYMPTLVSDALRQLLVEKGPNLPLMQLNREVGESSLSFVGNQCFECSYRATQKLIECGHTRIGTIYPNNLATCLDQQERIAGFNAALKNSGLTHNPNDDIIFDSFDSRISTDVISLLKKTDRPTAFFATNSVFLGNLFEKLVFCQLNVPDDLSITCFDLKETFAQLPVSIERIEQATDQVCFRAVELLNEMMTTHDYRPHRDRIAGIPTTGHSCRKLKDATVVQVS